MCALFKHKQALCDLGGGLCPRGRREALAGMDLVPPGSVYVYYDNVCCPQALWLSCQCKEQLDGEEQANVLIIHILDLDIKGPLPFGAVFVSTTGLYRP